MISRKRLTVPAKKRTTAKRKKKTALPPGPKPYRPARAPEGFGIYVEG
jgi:hypothetical protein